jgi:hypothetical protein
MMKSAASCPARSATCQNRELSPTIGSGDREARVFNGPREGGDDLHELPWFDVDVLARRFAISLEPTDDASSDSSRSGIDSAL